MKSFSDPPGIALFKFLLCIELIELNIFKSHEFYSSLKGLVGGEEGRRGRVVKCQLPMYCKIRQIFVSKKKKERISKKRKKILRVLNTLRDYEVGIPLTLKQ